MTTSKWPGCLALALEIVPDAMTSAQRGALFGTRVTILNDDAPRMIPDAVETYVRDLYQLFSVPGQAPRVPDEPGVANWVGNVQRGMPLAEVLRNFALSPEGRITAIQQTYVLLGRPITAAELTAVQQFLALGGTFTQLRATVLGFDEYYINRGGGSNAGFIQAAAVDLLGRSFSPSDLAFLGQLLARGLLRSTLARLILQAPEAINHSLSFSAPGAFGQESQASMAAQSFERIDRLGTLSGLVGRGLEIRAQRIETYQLSLTPNQRFVNRLYEDLLGRYATIREFSNDVNDVDRSGGSSAAREDLALRLATSQEFRGLVVDRLFQQILGRAPSRTDIPNEYPLSVLAMGNPTLPIPTAFMSIVERSVYAKLIGIGGTFDRIRAELLSSTEFLARLPTASTSAADGGRAWLAAADSLPGGDIPARLQFAQNVLSLDVAATLNALGVRRSARFQVALAALARFQGLEETPRSKLLASYFTEFLGRSFTDADLRGVVIGQTPTPVGNFLQAASESDLPREEQVIAYILGLDEYFRRVTQ